MNKKELLEELEKEPLDHAEIRIHRKFTLPEDVTGDLNRVQLRLKDLDKVIEELLCDGFPGTWSAINESFGDLERAIEDLADNLTCIERNMDEEAVADTVTVTDRKSEHGSRYHAVVIGE